MVIATSNDEINYRNHFVVLPLMNREVTLKTPIWTWFESDKWIKLGRPEIVPSSSLMDNEKSNLSMRRTTTAKYYFIYITINILNIILHIASWFFDGREAGAPGIREALSYVLDPDVGATERLQQLIHPVSVREGTQHRPQPPLLLLDKSWKKMGYLV